MGPLASWLGAVGGGALINNALLQFENWVENTRVHIMEQRWGVGVSLCSGGITTKVVAHPE